MEEEVNYSTVVFKKDIQPLKEKNEDETVYAEVKRTGKDSAAAVPLQAEVKAAAHFRLLLLCLGILCVILIGSIVAIVYISVNLSDVSAKYERVTLEKSILESQKEELNERQRILQNQTEELSRHREDLRSTLGVIIKFKNFPVDDFCPEKKCQPCRKGWILYGRKCYLFYEDSPWKTWEDSRQYCKDNAADLVVIDHLQEQEFISKHIKYYFSEHHGYWIGLSLEDNHWVWVDGRNDTLGFWTQKKLTAATRYAIIKPGHNLTESWSPEENIFLNKFICEVKALTWFD